jgi:hypothetical protein
MSAKINWTSWLLAILPLSGLAGVVAQSYLAWTAVRSGKSPVVAFWLSHQRVWGLLLNPWIFGLYLVVLALLLWGAIRASKKKGWTTKDVWFTGAVLAAIIALVARFATR